MFTWPDNGIKTYYFQSLLVYFSPNIIYNGVYYVVFKLSISDIIVIQQSSNGYRKQQSVLVIVSIILGLSEYK